MPADSTEKIRPATEADVPALGALFTEVFRADRPEEVWLWKYFRNPRGAASFVCEAAGRLVTHCGGTPVRFRDYAREYLALQSTDFMSSPSYPGGIGRGGVFVRTTERFFAACCGPSRAPVVYGFPGERHRVLGERLLGYRPVEPVGELRLEAAGPGLDTEPLTARRLPLLGRVPLTLGALRDPVYLRWRYLDHPLFRYELVRIPRLLGIGTQIAALVRQAQEAVYVMEVAGSFSHASVRSLTDRLRRANRPVIFWGALGHPVTRLLEEAGFRGRERDHLLEFRSFVSRQVPRKGEFYFTLGDYDVH